MYGATIVTERLLSKSLWVTAQSRQRRDSTTELRFQNITVAPEVGFGGSFPCIDAIETQFTWGNQANSSTTRASFFTAICWQFCWQQ